MYSPEQVYEMINNAMRTIHKMFGDVPISQMMVMMEKSKPLIIEVISKQMSGTVSNVPVQIPGDQKLFMLDANGKYREVDNGSNRVRDAPGTAATGPATAITGPVAVPIKPVIQPDKQKMGSIGIAGIGQKPLDKTDVPQDSKSPDIRHNAGIQRSAVQPVYSEVQSRGRSEQGGVKSGGREAGHGKTETPDVRDRRGKPVSAPKTNTAASRHGQPE